MKYSWLVLAQWAPGKWTTAPVDGDECFVVDGALCFWSKNPECLLLSLAPGQWSRCVMPES